MKRVYAAVACLLFAAFALAEESGDAPPPQEPRSPEALAVLQQADEAIKAVHSVRCRVKAVPSGVAANFFPSAEGTSVLVGWSGSGPQKFYADVQATGRDGQTRALTGGGDGNTFFLVDHTGKKGYEDMDPDVMGTSGRAVRGLGMQEYVHHAPFDDELNAESIALEGEEAVEGEPCRKVHVKYGGGRGESVWYFSKNDHLPRRRVQLFNFQGQEGKFEVTLTKLETNVEPESGLFRMRLPEGYERVEDFAP